MFCPNCGAQIPDGAQACMQCGTTIPAQTTPMQPQAVGTQPMQQDIIPQPTQTQPMQPQAAQTQSMQPNASAQQSGFGSQPTFSSVQPSYIPPSNYVPVTPLKKSKKTPIIIACCAAVVAIAAIVFFVFIFPKFGGASLAHKWSVTESGITMTYDFKGNTISIGEISMPIEWKDEGNGRLSITMSFMGMSETQYFTYSLSSDGKTLTLTDEEDSTPVEFKRAD